MDRRTFLKGAIAAPILLGFPWTRRVSASERQDWLAEAVARMKADGRPGIVICVPDDVEDAAALGTTLGALLEEPSISAPVVGGRSASAQRLLAEAVVVCLLTESSARDFPDRKGGQDLLLIDSEGRVVASAPLDKLALQSPSDLVAGLAKLLHGEDGVRLAERAKAEREGLSEEDGRALDAALAGLGSESYDERAAAAASLGRLAPQATATLSWEERASKDPEVAGRIEEAFAALHADALDARGGKLPYGTAWDEGSEADPCPACGMSVAPDDARRFLRFLSEEGK